LKCIVYLDKDEAINVPLILGAVIINQGLSGINFPKKGINEGVIDI
jgi:hypothetical protein